ncbi:hypothetical protein Terro_0584 [Terriglobus roseus DSM 18391]|uniref:Uncharacterized protein n=1 Tax=Terriglobus roseus (strain DSM 18391 / NRRL B-41598 / KBS 63) TaxID=926566 RepID=I3ZCF6_TERRK|nr:hypothetical protein Terro_0584 [Terriglobus roseus DSM 18391]
MTKSRRVYVGPLLSRVGLSARRLLDGWRLGFALFLYVFGWDGHCGGYLVGVVDAASVVFGCALRTWGRGLFWCFAVCTGPDVSDECEERGIRLVEFGREFLMRRAMAISALVGLLVPVFWGIAASLLLNLREGLASHIFWRAVSCTCPFWVLPGPWGALAMLPLDALLYAGVGAVVYRIRLVGG